MKFYIASSIDNIDQAQTLRDRLVALGHKQTNDWTLHGSLKNSPGLWREVSEKEIQGVLDADFVVVLLPGGRGTHTELGIAIGNGKEKIVVIGGKELREPPAENGRTCIFYHTRRVELFDTSEALLSTMPGYTGTPSAEAS